MEFKTYLKILKKYFYFIIALSILGALIGFLVAARQPTGQIASNILLIKTTPKNGDSTYNFDGYYAQERARNFTDTLVSLLKSSSFTNNILEPGQSLKIEKEAPQVISISAFASSSNDAQDLLTKIETHTNQKIAEFFQGELLIEPISDPAIGQKTNLPKAIYSFAGVLLGLAFALFVITLKEYFAP